MRESLKVPARWLLRDFENLIKWAQEIDTSKPIDNRNSGERRWASRCGILRLRTIWQRLAVCLGNKLFWRIKLWCVTQFTLTSGMVLIWFWDICCKWSWIYTTKANAALDQDKATPRMIKSFKGKIGGTLARMKLGMMWSQRDFVAAWNMCGLVDYIGEPTPANKIENAQELQLHSHLEKLLFPTDSMDTTGLPKSSYYFYQSQWNDGNK